MNELIETDQQDRPKQTVAEFKVVRVRECEVAIRDIDRAEDLLAFWRAHVATASWYRDGRECLVVFFLDGRRQLLGLELCGIGTKAEVSCDSASLFRTAIMLNSSAIVVAHSHPECSSTPSVADVEFAREMWLMGSLLKIRLSDSLIVAERVNEFEVASLRAMGYFDNFNKEALTRTRTPLELVDWEGPQHRGLEQTVLRVVSHLEKLAEQITVANDPNGQATEKISAECRKIAKWLQADYDGAYKEFRDVARAALAAKKPLSSQPG